MTKGSSNVKRLFAGTIPRDGEPMMRDRQPSVEAPMLGDGQPLATLAGGEQVLLLKGQGFESLSLRSREGNVLLEYDTRSGQVRISGPIQAVSVASGAPRVELRSAGDLDLVAGGSVNVRAGAGVTLEAANGAAAPSAIVRVMPQGLTFAARQLAIAADGARMSLSRASVRGGVLDARWSRVRLDSERLELNARDVRSRLGNLVQEVEQAFTLKAGRVRQWITGSIVTRAERSELVAREDVRIDGKIINLG